MTLLQLFNKNWLLEKKLYREAFEALAKKIKKDPKKNYVKNKVDDLTFEAMALDPLYSINRIIKEIEKPQFDFSPFKLVRLQKSNSTKIRDIYIPSWPDKLLLTVMATILQRESKDLILKEVYSFQKGKSHLQALKSFKAYIKDNRNYNKLWVLKRDISSYGDSISHELLINQLKKDIDLTHQDLFLKLLKKALKIEHFSMDDSTKGACLIVGVPSGSPLCPPIENYYLHTLDRKLVAIENSFYARYGDDFIFAHYDIEKALHAQKIIDEITSELKLEIKSEKKKNIVFCSPLGAEKFEGWDHVLSFEHLGARISSKGEIGPKREKLLDIHYQANKELNHIVKTLGKFEIDYEFKVLYLKRALSKWFERSTRGGFLALLLEQNEIEQFCRNFDIYKTQWLVKALKNYWCLTPKKAWVTFRKLKVPSLTRSYHLKFIKSAKSFRTTKKTA
jgi:retron-type reverse transcriptase